MLYVQRKAVISEASKQGAVPWQDPRSAWDRVERSKYTSLF